MGIKLRGFARARARARYVVILSRRFAVPLFAVGKFCTPLARGILFDRDVITSKSSIDGLHRPVVIVTNKYPTSSRRQRSIGRYCRDGYGSSGFILQQGLQRPSFPKRVVQAGSLARSSSCILGLLGNLCANLGNRESVCERERALTRNANSRRYRRPDGDYQLPCQLHPVQGRDAAHAGSGILPTPSPPARAPSSS